MTERFILALDQGTTSSRAILFDRHGRPHVTAQQEFPQQYPSPGHVTHDPEAIWSSQLAVAREAIAKAEISIDQVAAIGVTNQRETTVVWNPHDGRPWHNAIVWQDTRTNAAVAALEPSRQLIQQRTGLPPASYFSAAKLQWLLDNVSDLRARAERGDALFGTVDSWIIWHLTGGMDGGLHVTDVTNASRTQLMSLEAREWDEELLTLFRIPRRMLPRIHPSSDPSAFGVTRASGPVGAEVPIGGNLGDQHAAMVGQTCFAPGEAKNTYGTGNFMLLNTGSRIVRSTSGLITTIAYALDDVEPVYALEGSVAVSGSAVQWLRDKLEVIRTAGDIEALAASVPSSAGLYFVPAFSGLFAPYWRADARGVIAGLTHFHTKAHLARATLEAICFQTRAVLDAMVQDSGIRLEVLKVDGGATANELLMQNQADILGVPVVRPVVTETTALGAAYAAGLAVGLWTSLGSLRSHWMADRQWQPLWSDDQREEAYAGWRKAVDRSLGWAEHPSRKSG